MKMNLSQRVLAVLVGLGMMALLAPSAAAQDDPMCQGDMTTIASLAHCIHHAWEMGHIDNVGVATSTVS